MNRKEAEKLVWDFAGLNRKVEEYTLWDKKPPRAVTKLMNEIAEKLIISLLKE